MAVTLDQTDLKLIDLLQKDGRATVRDLAEQVGLSPSGCMRRIQVLEENAVIVGYQARVSPEMMGLSVQALVHVELQKNDREQLEAFARQVNRWTEVIACYATTGQTDYVLHVVVKDLPGLKNFLMEKLTKDAPVLSVDTALVLDIVKNSGTYAFTG